jgi:cytochrome c5
VSKQDTHFFNVFSVVLGLLAAFAVLVFALARVVGENEQAAAVLQDPLLAQSVAARITPPTRVAVAGQDNSALTIAPVTVAASNVTAVVLENGQQVYDVACATCHAAALLGAPKPGDTADWAPRIAQGRPTLYEHAIKGFTGRKGTMPAKGGRTDISDELVRAAVDHMLGN